jgi:branched-chain amino acid transport system ATP-binding protein
VSLGISHVPENRQLFAELTVMENLRLGSWGRRDRNGIKDDIEQVFPIFPFPTRNR